MTLFEGELHPFHGCWLQEEESGSIAADFVIAAFGQGEKITVTVDVCDVDFPQRFMEFTGVDAEFDEFASVRFGRWRHVATVGDHALNRLKRSVLHCVRSRV